ncbi:DUF5119 domain-containing protein [Parabacteroides sp.]
MDKRMFVSIGLLLLGGCTYGDTDLYNQQRGKVTIALDWGGVALPDSAAFYFYPSGQNTPQIRKAGGAGFEGTLPAGTYQVMVVNTGYSQLTVQSAQGYGQAMAYADPATGKSRLRSRAGEALLIDSPHNLYGTGLPQVTVGKEGAVYTAYPRQLVFPVQLDVIVEGPLSIDQIDGELSGVSSSVHIPTGNADFSEDAAILFPLEKQADGRFRSSATTFGLRPGMAESGEKENRLRLDVRLADQRTFSSELDITDLVEEAVGNEITGTITATIELELTVDPSVPDGFNLQLVGWNTGTGSAGEEE